MKIYMFFSLIVVLCVSYNCDSHSQKEASAKRYFKYSEAFGDTDSIPEIDIVKDKAKYITKVSDFVSSS